MHSMHGNHQLDCCILQPPYKTLQLSMCPLKQTSLKEHGVWLSSLKAFNFIPSKQFTVTICRGWFNLKKCHLSCGLDSVVNLLLQWFSVTVDCKWTTFCDSFFFSPKRRYNSRYIHVLSDGLKKLFMQYWLTFAWGVFMALWKYSCNIGR